MTTNNSNWHDRLNYDRENKKTRFFKSGLVGPFMDELTSG